MKHWFIYIAVLMGIYIPLPAQQFSPAVIASDGGTGKAGGIQLEYTLGEVAIQGRTGLSSSYTEGFHQPVLLVDEINVAALPGSKEEIPSISIRPNPVSTSLNIHFSSAPPVLISFALSDAHGQPLIKKEINTYDGDMTLDMSSHAPGLYLIQLLSADGRISSVFKIIKI